MPTTVEEDHPPSRRFESENESDFEEPRALKYPYTRVAPDLDENNQTGWFEQVKLELISQGFRDIVALIKRYVKQRRDTGIVRVLRRSGEVDTVVEMCVQDQSS